MADQHKEHIWLISDGNGAGTQCRACGETLAIGDTVVTCPRCKGIHHLECWKNKSGCSTHGCFQLADASLTEGRKRTFDPPTKDSFSWVPAAITIILLLTVVGGAIWSSMKGKQTAHILTVMVPVGSDLSTIEQVAKEFDTKDESLSVNVLSIPVDQQNMYYDEKLVIMLAAREAPDIILLPYDRFLAYLNEGAFVPLDDLKPELKRFYPYGQRLANGSVAGHLYGVPHPSKAGLFSIPALSSKQEPAKKLLMQLVRALPLKPGINDKKLAQSAPSVAPTPTKPPK